MFKLNRLDDGRKPTYATKKEFMKSYHCGF